MKLTQDEVQFVESYIEKLEKQARRWRFQKWSAVICFVLGLGLLLAMDTFAPHLRSVVDDTFSPPVATHEDTSTQLMKSYVDVKIVLLRTEIFLYLKAFIVAGIGTSMFVWTFSNKKKDQQDLLLAKFLRDMINKGDTQSGPRD